MEKEMQNIIRTVSCSGQGFEFAERVKEQVLEMQNREVPADMILNMFGEQVFKDIRIRSTKEYHESKNWMKSFSLVIWTEKNDGAEDYTEWELKYMDLVIKVIAPIDPDIMYHENTRLNPLFLPKKN